MINLVAANQPMCALQHVCFETSAVACLELGTKPQPAESTNCVTTSCLHRQMHSVDYAMCTPQQVLKFACSYMTLQLIMYVK